MTACSPWSASSPTSRCASTSTGSTPSGGCRRRTRPSRTLTFAPGLRRRRRAAGGNGNETGQSRAPGRRQETAGGRDNHPASEEDVVEQAWIISGARTPIGKFLGGLSPLKAPELGAIAINEAMKRAGLGAGDRRRGHHGPRGAGRRRARRRRARRRSRPASRSGVGAMTINKVCGSGLKAVMLAAQAIKRRRRGGRRRRRHGVDAHGAALPVHRPRPAASWATPSWSTAWSSTACGARSTTATWADLAEYTAEKLRRSGAPSRTSSRSQSHRKAAAAMKAGPLRGRDRRR